MSPVASKNETNFWFLLRVRHVSGIHTATQGLRLTRGLSCHHIWVKEELEVPMSFSLPRLEVTHVIFARFSLAGTGQGPQPAPRRARGRRSVLSPPRPAGRLDPSPLLLVVVTSVPHTLPNTVCSHFGILRQADRRPAGSHGHSLSQVQQSSFYGYTGMLPKRYTQGVMTGESEYLRTPGWGCWAAGLWRPLPGEPPRRRSGPVWLGPATCVT